MKEKLLSKKFLITITIVLFLLIFFGILNLIFYKKNDYTRATKIEYVELNKTIKLQKEQMIFLNDEDKTTLKFISVIDSRCKKDNNCIWEGQIEYTLIYKNNKKEETILLGSVKNKEYTIDKYTIYYLDGDTKELSIKIGEKEK